MKQNFSYKIYTLGCKVNQYDSASLSRDLDRLGLIKTEKNADFIVVNTCVVTKTAVSKNQRMLNKAKLENLDAKTILMGCWPKAYSITNGFDVDKIFKVAQKKEIIKYIKTEIKLKKPANNMSEAVPRRAKSRYTIKIQDGCTQFCSYCIIPYTRGKLKSRSEEEVLKEIEMAANQGHQEVVLCGIHLGLYGRDTDKNFSSLYDLLKQIIKTPNLGRIRLSSIEINEVSDELLGLMQKSEKICNHLHIPIQSANEKILKLMNRPYSLLKFKKRIKEIRKIIPDIAITTDVIVGFPGESDDDFEKACETIEEIGFSRLHVFPFSAHEKTPASKLPGHLDKKTKMNRASKLRAIGESLEKKYQDRFIGKELNVLIEKKIGNRYIGKCEYYFEVGTLGLDKRLEIRQINKVFFQR